MSFINPTVSEFKAYFHRDFPFGSDIDTSVVDADIEKAVGQTDVNINRNLFTSQQAYTIGYVLLTAHYLVLDLRNASQGLKGQFNFLETSKTVGSVSQSFSIPQRILDNPYFAMLTKTTYGAKYLEHILPQLAGPFGVVYGRTQP